MPVEHHKQQGRHVGIKTSHRAGLGARGRVKKRRETQPHLESRDLAGQLEGAKNEAHGKADGQSHTHLLHHHPQRPRIVDTDHRLVGHAGLRGISDQKRKRNLRA